MGKVGEGEVHESGLHPPNLVNEDATTHGRNHLAFAGNLYYSLSITVKGRRCQLDTQSKKMIQYF
jgi:hypothetical protein